MNVSVDLDPATIGFPKPLTPSSGCDLDCKERLFRTLAGRGRLRILDTLCKGAKTVEQIAAATGQSQANVSIQLKRLVDCGCVRPERIADSLLYTLSPPDHWHRPCGRRWAHPALTIRSCLQATGV